MALLTFFRSASFLPWSNLIRKLITEDQDRYLPIVIQRNGNIPGSVFQFGKTNDRNGKTINKKLLTMARSFNILQIKPYRSRSSQGFRPVCFLKAVEKWEIQEYPISIATSDTDMPFSYRRLFAFSILSFWK